MDDVAVVVGQDLEFDVMRVLDEFLDVDPALPKAFSASVRARVKALTRLISLCATRMPRPPPPATALIMTG